MIRGRLNRTTRSLTLPRAQRNRRKFQCSAHSSI
jgi:hypothetical protein